MIAFLKGTLAGKTATTAYIEVNGVGYAVGMSQASLSKLPEAGAPVEVHTFLQVRDDALALYGFLALEEKALFERLIGVGGVGPKVALAALSAFSPAGLVAAVQAQDVAAVQRIPGVGKKTASRIILELKDKLAKGQIAPGGESYGGTGVTVIPENKSSEAAAALAVLGYSQSEIAVALKGIDVDGLALEEIIKQALKRMVKN